MSIKYFKNSFIGALLLLLLLNSCSTANIGQAGSKDETSPNSPSSEELIIKLTNGGKPVYTLIRSDSAKLELSLQFSEFKKEISEKTEINFKLDTDWLKKGGTPDASSYEILYGRTNHPETASVSEKIGANGYAIEALGNKIVIYGTDEDNLKEAEALFISSLEKNSDGELLLHLPKEGYLKSDNKNLFEKGSIKDYTIVCAKDNSKSAEKLNQEIKAAFGYELSVKNESEPESEREILIGTCERKEALAAVSSLESKTSYILHTESKKLLLAGISSFGTEQAVEKFISDYINSAFCSTVHIPENFHSESSNLASPENLSRSQDTDIRIMSFNILADQFGDHIPVEGRSEIVAATILTYLPDVIGLQEVSDNWYKQLPQLVSEKYTFVNTKTNAGLINFTGLAYNRTTLKLIDSDCELYSKRNDDRIRLMNWAVFETIPEGKRFTVINTHFGISQNRKTQALELSEKINVLKQNYSCPVIITGDYNCTLSSNEYKVLVANAGVENSRLTAKKAVNSDYHTGHNIYELSEEGGEKAIDHITYTDGVLPLFYVTHNFAPIIDASDHNPIMADFSINNQ